MGCNVMESSSYAKYAKKVIIGLAVVCVALALITTNNAATMMAVVSSRTGGAAVASNNTALPVQGGDVQQPSGNTGSNSSTGTQSAAPVSNTGSSSTDTGSSSSSSTPSSSGTQTAAPAGDSGAASGTTDTGSTPSGDAGQQTPVGPADNNAAASGEMTKEQVVDLYVKSLNKAKASASKVILVKDGALNYQEIFEAGAFSSFGPMLKSFFKLEELNADSSKEELPPRNINCNLNAANVESATCKEENGVYNVEIILKDSNNPQIGDGGVGSVTNIISEDQITGGVKDIPGISLNNINLLYTQVKITATIDKATGNLTHVIADAPAILSLDAKAFVMSINGARVGIETVSEFSVAY